MDKKELFYSLENIFNEYQNSYSSIKKVKCELETVHNPFYSITCDSIKVDDIKRYYESIFLVHKIDNKDMEYFVEPDIIGKTITIYYVDGKLDSILLRSPFIGKGYDITHLLYSNINIPLKIKSKKKVSIKATISIDRDDLKAINVVNLFKGTGTYYTVRTLLDTLYKNKPEEVEEIPFTIYPYDIDVEGESFKTHFDKRVRLKEVGFLKDSFFKVCKFDEIRDIFNQLNTIRDNTNLYTSGLFIKINNLDIDEEIGGTCSVALTNIRSITNVVHIGDDINEYGILTPFAYVDPFIYTKTKSSKDKINLVSYKYIKKIDIRENDDIVVLNDGDTLIPSVVRVNKGTRRNPKKEVPTICPYCNSKLEILGSNGFKCTNYFCKEKVKKRLIHYCNVMEIPLCKKDIELLIFSKCVSSPYDLYHLDKMANNVEIRNKDRVCKAIKKSRKSNLTKLLYALCIPYLSEDQIKLICMYANNDFKKVRRIQDTRLSKITRINNLDLCNIILEYIRDDNFNFELYNILDEVKI